MTIDELQDALDTVSTVSVKRLIIALAYKDGVAVETLSERYDIPRSTIYSWLDRFEDVPIEEALQDEDRLGRPPVLTNEERAELRADLNRSPRTFGFDDATWTTRAV